MTKLGWAICVLAMADAGAALAQTAAGGAPPRAEPLTVFGVVADASLPVKAVMIALLLAAIGSVAIWALSLRKVGAADARGLAGALGRLKIVRSAGVPLGVLGAGYTLLNIFLGLSNVRPTPPLSVVAPGWAEAALAIVLGALATTVAVICERHLEARIRQAAV